jgi:hypothetical protein
MITLGFLKGRAQEIRGVASAALNSVGICPNQKDYSSYSSQQSKLNFVRL